MIGLASLPILVAFWVLVCWRVRVERGRVHLSPLERFAAAMRRFERALGLALLPAVRRAAEQLAAWNRDFIAAVEADPELRALLEEER